MLAMAGGYGITPPASHAVQDLQEELMVEEEKPTPRVVPTGSVQQLPGEQTARSVQNGRRKSYSNEIFLGITIPYFKNILNVCSVIMSQKYGGP